MPQYRKGLSTDSRSLGISSSLLNNLTPTILSLIPREVFIISDISSRFIAIHHLEDYIEMAFLICACPRRR